MRIPVLTRRAEADTHAAAPTPSHPQAEHTASLAAQRDRLTEKFAVLQSELGGTFYEMAIRDHVRMEVLMGKAAELQRLDAELSAVEHLLQSPDGRAGGNCPACGAVHARGAVFCGQCGKPLTNPPTLP
jgi:hypothetical protein